MVFLCAPLTFCTLASPRLQIGLPSSREQYIHRLGRTARAGKRGQGLLMLAPYEQVGGAGQQRGQACGSGNTKATLANAVALWQTACEPAMRQRLPFLCCNPALLPRSSIPFPPVCSTSCASCATCHSRLRQPCSCPTLISLRPTQQLPGWTPRRQRW